MNCVKFLRPSNYEEFKSKFFRYLSEDEEHKRNVKYTNEIIKKDNFEFLTTIDVGDIFIFQFWCNENDYMMTLWGECLKIYVIPDGDVNYFELFNSHVDYFLRHEFDTWFLRKKYLIEKLKNERYIEVY